jgi:hypothetical protein
MKLITAMMHAFHILNAQPAKWLLQTTRTQPLLVLVCSVPLEHIKTRSVTTLQNVKYRIHVAKVKYTPTLIYHALTLPLSREHTVALRAQNTRTSLHQVTSTLAVHHTQHAWQGSMPQETVKRKRQTAPLAQKTHTKMPLTIVCQAAKPKHHVVRVNMYPTKQRQRI